MDDTISRQQFVDAFWKTEVEFRPSQIDEVMKILEQLPSAQPEYDCVLKQFGECTYDKTGCSDCEIKTKIRTALSAQPKIIHCRECKWWGYDDDDGAVRVCHAAKHGFMSSHWDIQIYRTYRGDFWCADAERREDG